MIGWQSPTPLTCLADSISGGMEPFSTSSFVYSGPSSVSEALQGYISDLVLTVSACSLSTEVEAYYSSFTCADLCDSLCTGPGHHSCSNYIQLIDPYIQSNTQTITGNNLIFEGRTDELKDISVTFWLDSNAFTTTPEVFYFKISQMYLDSYNVLKTKSDVFTSSIIYETTNHFHSTMRAEVVKGEFGLFGRIQNGIEHIALVQEGYIFVGNSKCNSQQYIKLCNVVQGQKFCKQAGDSWDETIWIRYYDNDSTLPNSMVVGVDTNEFKVIDGRIYDACLTDEEFFEIYEERFKTCAAVCMECSDALTCIRCKKGFYLNFGVCLQCPEACSECYGSSCDSCAFYKNSLCVGAACQSTEYSVGRDCFDCDSSCLTCKGGDTTDCLTCDINKKLDPTTGACIPNADCEGGTYFDGISCVACPTGCSLCVSDLECTSCQYKYYLGPSPTVCTSTCPISTWRNGLSRTCDPCHDYCKTCNGPAYNDYCMSCYAPAYLSSQQHICDLVCFNKKEFTDDSDRKCHTCNSACSTCFWFGLDSCTACVAGYFLYQTTCMKSCVIGYWGNTANNKCEPCHEWCSVCTGPGPTSCTNCKGVGLLTPRGNECSSTCEEGYWSNYQTNRCDECHKSCSNCNGPLATDNCKACRNDALKQPDSNSCLTNCPNGYWPDIARNSCSLCHEFCSVCLGPSSTECLVCSTGNYLQIDERTCIPDCPEGFVRNAMTSKCDDCLSTCGECTVVNNRSFCSSCTSGLLLQPELSCDLSCPAGYWGDLAKYICLPCDSMCLECYGRTSDMCTSCNDGFALQPDNKTCAVRCPAMYWEEKSVCTPCEYPCLNCDNALNCESSECICKAYCEIAYSIPCRSCLDCMSVRCAQCLGASLEALSSTEYSLSFNGTLVGSLTAVDLTLTIGEEPVPFVINKSSKGYTLTSESKAETDVKVMVKFLHPAQVSDAQGLSLKIDSASVTSYSETVVVIDNQGYESGAQGAMVVMFLTGLMKMNFSVAWLLMNSMQLISFTPLGMPFLPEDLKVFLGSMDTSSSIPNVFSYFLTYDNSTPPTNARAYGIVYLGYKRADFIENAGNMHTTLSFLGFSWLIVYLLSFVGKLEEKMRKVLKQFSFNIWIRFFVQSYMKVVVAGLIQVLYGEFGYQYTLAVIALVQATQASLGALPFVFFYKLWRSKNMIFIADIQGLSSWSILFTELKRNSGFVCLMYYPLFCFRRILSSVTLLLLADYEITQCITQFVLNIVVTPRQFGLHMFITLPFTSSTVMLLSWYGELCICGLHIILPVFLWPWGSTGLNVLIVSVKIIVVSAIVLSLIIQAKSAYEFLRKICKPKRTRKVLSGQSAITVGEIRPSTIVEL